MPPLSKKNPAASLCINKAGEKLIEMFSGSGDNSCLDLIDRLVEAGSGDIFDGAVNLYSENTPLPPGVLSISTRIESLNASGDLVKHLSFSCREDSRERIFVVKAGHYVLPADIIPWRTGSAAGSLSINSTVNKLNHDLHNGSPCSLFYIGINSAGSAPSMFLSMRSHYSEGYLWNPSKLKAALEKYSPTGEVSQRRYYTNGRLSDPAAGVPSSESFHPAGRIRLREWHDREGNLHRDPKQGPASEMFSPEGERIYIKYAIHGEQILCREPSKPLGKSSRVNSQSRDTVMLP